MASKAMPGTVAVTHDTWAQIKDRFESESPGELEIKGKGIIPVVAVRREKPRP
jgi:adenylate cyclase